MNKVIFSSYEPGVSKIIVTSRDFHFQRQTRSAIRKAVPGALLRRTGMGCVFMLEAEGDPLELAKKVNRSCHDSIGRATAVLVEVESSVESIKEAAVTIGREQIAEDEKFCFRLYKRGAHRLDQETPKIEYEIGGEIWVALHEKYGKKPRVDLREPDIMIIAEVLGPITAIGVLRLSWRQIPEEPSPQPDMPLISA